MITEQQNKAITITSICAITLYFFAMLFDIMITLTVQQTYPALFHSIEQNPITFYFIETFSLPFNLVIPFIIILSFFLLTKNRFQNYSQNKKIYYITGILCYTIAMSVIHIVGASGAFIYGWL